MVKDPKDCYYLWIKYCDFITRIETEIKEPVNHYDIGVAMALITTYQFI